MTTNEEKLIGAIEALLGPLLDKQASAPAKKAQYEFLKHLPETWAYIEQAQKAIADIRG